METWRQFIAENVPVHQFADGLSLAEVQLAEERLGIALPKELKALLMETDGVFIEYGIPLVWPIERIIDENARIRSDASLREMYMPLDCLLFFADAGNGDLFAYAIVNGAVRCTDVFAWNHEDDSRFVVATSLRRFLKGWTDGTITL